MESFSILAPTRADLAGGTLDIWPLYCLNGGAKTINIALDLHAAAHFTVAPSSKFQMEIQPASNLQPWSFQKPLTMAEAKNLPPLYRFPVAVASHYLADKPELPSRKISLRLETAVPPQSGLGGSSSLCVAVVRGLARILGDYIEQGWQFRMLSWVRDMEAAFLGTMTGSQDYLAALFGGVNCYVWRLGGVSKVPYAVEVFDGIAERALVLYSGEMHDSGASNWDVISAILAGDKDALQGLREIGQIADQLDAELQSGNLSWKHIGRYLTEEWAVRKRLFKVNTKRLDEILQFLQAKRILGAKVCGAAAGGSLFVLVEPELKDALARDCEAAGIKVLRCRCTNEGAVAKPVVAG